MSGPVGLAAFFFADGDAEAFGLAEDLAEAVDDALVEDFAGALADQEELRLVGERALSYVSDHHDWDRIGEMTAASYRAALKGRRG